MGKKKPLKLIFFIFFIVFMYDYYDQLINIMDYIIWFIYYNENEVVRYIIASTSVLGAVGLAKKLLWDTRQITKLSKEIGMTGLYDSIRVIHPLVKLYGIKEAIRRIKMIDQTELQMKLITKTIKNNIESVKPELKLSFKQKLILGRKILEWIKLISKQEDINKIENSIKVSNKRNEKRQPIIDEYTEKRKLEIIDEFFGNHKIKNKTGY